MILDKSKFEDKRELLSYIKANKIDLIEFKRTQTKLSDPFSLNTTAEKTIKALNTNYTDDVESGVIKRTIVGNTYNWLDNHDDVHANGLFSKSINERIGKIWHLHDHIHQITAKVGKLTNIYEKEVDWLDLGINKAGTTMALMADSDIDKTKNPQIFKDYLNNEIQQHSVGMIYVKVDVAIDDESDKEAFAQWSKYLPLLGNPIKAMEQGYFFVVKEAKLIEISAVLEGSNELTPTINNITTNDKSVEPLEVKQSINVDYLINNFKL